MKNSLWLVIVVVAAFLGFIVGYSVPPLVEVGMIGGKAEKVGLKADMTKERKDYYSDLHQEK